MAETSPTGCHRVSLRGDNGISSDFRITPSFLFSLLFHELEMSLDVTLFPQTFVTHCTADLIF